MPRKWTHSHLQQIPDVHTVWKAASRQFCSGHAKGGVVDVKNKRCRHPNSNKISSHGVDGSRTKEFCAEHAGRAHGGC